MADESKDMAGEGGVGPLVLALDIRPPAGPPSAEFIVLGCAVSAFFVATFGTLLVLPDYGISWATPFLPFALPPAVFALVVWLRRWLWRLRESGPDSAARERRYEAALRRAWRPISYDTQQRVITADSETLHMEWLRPALEGAGLATPRAIVIARPSARGALPLRVEACFHEPVEIDALPAWSAARTAHRGVWSGLRHGVVLVGMIGFVLIAARSIGGLVEFPARSRWQMAGALAMALISIVVYVLGRVRARGWWREILVGPSFIQTRDHGYVNRYTPENTTLVVRPRRCFAQGILAILCTDGSPNGPPSAHIVFFGFDDPGFVALWNAWINPLRADHLIGTDVVLGAGAKGGAGETPAR